MMGRGLLLFGQFGHSCGGVRGLRGGVGSCTFRTRLQSPSVLGSLGLSSTPRPSGMLEVIGDRRRWRQGPGDWSGGWTRGQERESRWKRTIVSVHVVRCGEVDFIIESIRGGSRGRENRDSIHRLEVPHPFPSEIFMICHGLQRHPGWQFSKR